MTKPIETLLFDFGGTLDADGVAWKERFYTLYRSEGLDMTADAFAPAFFAADRPLVGGLPPATGLSERSMLWPPTSKPNWRAAAPELTTPEPSMNGPMAIAVGA